MSVYGYKYGRVPEALLYSAASDRACRLHALLTRWADTRPEEHPTRRELAKLLHCSVDSVDRAVKELEKAGFLQITPRYAEGVRIANVYEVDVRGGRTDAGGGRTVAATITSGNEETPGDGGRTGAAGGGRTGAAVNKEVVRTSITTEEEETLAPPAAAEVKKRRVQDHPEGQRLCGLLADLIAENADGDRPYPKGKPAPKKWQDAVRLLLTADTNDKGHYTVEQVEYMIRWSQADSFESGVVGSMPKLRERRRTLVKKIKDQKQQHNGTNGTYRNGQPERRSPVIPEADLSRLPPTDPEKLAAWYDRQLEDLPT